MPLYNRLLCRKSACDDAPLLTACTAVDDGLNNCPGSGNGWRYHPTCTISGTLQTGQEFVWERQANRSGNWAEIGRGTSTTGPTTGDTTIGANGGGASQTNYVQFRVYIVPTGQPTSAACRGPQTSSEISRTANACLS